MWFVIGLALSAAIGALVGDVLAEGIGAAVGAALAVGLHIYVKLRKTHPKSRPVQWQWPPDWYPW